MDTNKSQHSRQTSHFLLQDEEPLSADELQCLESINYTQL